MRQTLLEKAMVGVMTRKHNYSTDLEQIFLPSITSRMGAADSKQLPVYAAATRMISREELESLSAIFDTIAGARATEVQAARLGASRPNNAMLATELPHLFRAIQHVAQTPAKDSLVASRQAYIAAMILVKHGSLVGDKLPFILALLGLDADVERVPVSCIADCMKRLSYQFTAVIGVDKDQGCAAFVEYIVASASELVSAAASPPEPQLSIDNFVKWLKRTHVAERLIQWELMQLLVSAPATRDDMLCPMPRVPSRLLDPMAAFLIDTSLPADKRGTWQLLYASELHGTSFAALKYVKSRFVVISSIVRRGAMRNAGSTVLVLQDEDGNVFGGYAHELWTVNAAFYGWHTVILKWSVDLHGCRQRVLLCAFRQPGTPRAQPHGIQ